MTWTVDFTPAARREFDRLDGTIQNRVSQKIDELERNGPHVAGIKLLYASERLYRLRVGNWRIIFQIDFKHSAMTIAKIAHRSEAYR
jgi:mRNA interferase RelE/StbE